MTKPACAFVIATVLLSGSAAGVSAGDREWRRGVWIEVNVKRPRFVIGVQPSQRGRGPEMTVIRTYVIDADDLRLELKEPQPAPLRSVDAAVGESVTFALEKNTVYVRGDDGNEYRLQVTKRGNPPKEDVKR